MDSAPLLLGGSLTLADGVRTRLQIAPALPGDKFQMLYLYLASSAVEADIYNTITLRVAVAQDTIPDTSAAFDAIPTQLTPAGGVTLPLQARNGGATNQAVGGEFRIPLLHTAGQRLRRLVLDVTANGCALAGAAFVEVYRTPPDPKQSQF